MKIHAMSTGTVRVKHSFLFPGKGLRRQLNLFLPGPFSDPLPIHCWAIEHDGRLILIDTGESSHAKNGPFVRFEVAPEDELPGEMERAGLSIDEISEVILTHHHGDHVDGLPHVRAPASINQRELAYASAAFSSVMRKVLRQPLPPGFAPTTFVLEDGPFGAFPRSRRVTDDGRIVLVDTEGHTPGHVSVICIDDEGRHVMLAGDVTDTLEQLMSKRADAVAPNPKVHVATLETILAHCREHPTIYLPSHDPGSAERLAGAITVDFDS